MKKSVKVREIPGMEYHPKSPDATPETLERLSGIIRLAGPVPSLKFMEDEQDDRDGQNECEPDPHARR